MGTAHRDGHTDLQRVALNEPCVDGAGPRRQGRVGSRVASAPCGVPSARLARGDDEPPANAGGGHADTEPSTVLHCSSAAHAPARAVETATAAQAHASKFCLRSRGCRTERRDRRLPVVPVAVYHPNCAVAVPAPPCELVVVSHWWSGRSEVQDQLRNSAGGTAAADRSARLAGQRRRGFGRRRSLLALLRTRLSLGPSATERRCVSTTCPTSSRLGSAASFG